MLSNARCLTEGVDVPALDAVLFLAPRKSQVDVVQAVGRVMRQGGRQADGLHHPAGGNQPGSRSPDQALDDNKTFQGGVGACCGPCAATTTASTWRSTRWTSTIVPTERIKIINGGEDNGEAKDRISQLSLGPGVQDPARRHLRPHRREVRRPQVLAPVGRGRGRRSPINIRVRVSGLLQSPERITLRQDFHAFLADLQTNAESIPAGGGPGGDGGPASGYRSGLPGAVRRLRLRGQQSRFPRP